MNNYKNLLILLILLFINKVFGQEPKILFQTDSILKLTIKLHLNEVIHDTEIRDYHQAKLSYFNQNSKESIHIIKIKVRGKSRTNVNICRFPPLELNFKKKKTENSLFEGQNKLKLVTHCKNAKAYSDYILEEYMTYKMYQLITPFSHRVRLCEITYIDLDKPKNTITQVGFLIENIKDVAERNNMMVYKDSIIHQDFCNKTELDKLTIFQFMIGNLDWEVSLRHNIKLISPSKRDFPIAVPYDFDYAGIIFTSYAVPPESLKISSVRTRLFRGLCRLNNGYDVTLDYYQKLKPDLFSLVNNSNYLSDKSIKSVDKYLESFYKILDDPKLVNQKIVTSCWITHKHLYETN